MIKTSLIITVYNRSASLRKALISLKNQSVLPDELIIADDGSAENIVSNISDILPEFNFPVKYVRQKNKGFRLARNRNNGVRNAEGDFFIFLDQDLVFTPNLLATFINNGKAKRFITGMPVWLDEKRSIQVTEERIKNNTFLELIDKKDKSKAIKQFKKDRRYYYLHKLYLTNQPRLRGGMCGINRSEFEKINGYDENFIGWGAEDDDLGRRLYKIGAEGFNPFENEFAIHLYHKPAVIKGAGVKEQTNYGYYQKKKHEIKKGNYKAEFGLNNLRDNDKIIVEKLK